MHEANLNGVDLNLLKVLNAVERAGSVTGAARALGVGQPAVSQALGRLRETLKDDLFVRGPEGMTPTPRMRELIGPIRTALGQIEFSLFGDQAFDAGAETLYRIGASDYAAAMMAPKIIRAMADRLPRATLSILRADRSDATTLLADGEIDLAIGLFPHAKPWLRRRQLYSETHVCVFNPAQLALEVPLSLTDYLAHDHMLVSLDGTPEGFVDKLLHDMGHRRRVTVTTPYFLQSAYLLERLPLIATLPERFVTGCSTLSTMSRSPLPLDTPGFDVSAFWRAGDDRNPRIAALRECVIRAASQGAARPRSKA